MYVYLVCVHASGCACVWVCMRALPARVAPLHSRVLNHTLSLEVIIYSMMTALVWVDCKSYH